MIPTTTTAKIQSRQHRRRQQQRLFLLMTTTGLLLALLLLLSSSSSVAVATAFVLPSSSPSNSVLQLSTRRTTASSPYSARSIRRGSSAGRQQQQQRSTSRLNAIAAVPKSVPNPFKKLPWNVQKEREREARRMKQERAVLHRELGIAEDATYEEIVAATDHLLAKAGSDLKAKIKIEVAKDKILQIRLNERLAGLAVASKDARAQSSFEVQGYVVFGCTYVLSNHDDAASACFTWGICVCAR